MTKRVIEDNKPLSPDDIRMLLKERCGIDRCVFVEEEPDDKTGHIDGTARFLDEKTIAVGEYRSNDAWLRDAADKIADPIAQSLPDFSIVRVPHGPVGYSEGKEGMPSARGNHINFLRHKDCVFLPFYGDKEDEAAMRSLEEAGRKLKIVPIRHPQLNELSKYGGALNCISCNI
jgi:agmatine deiminase